MKVEIIKMYLFDVCGQALIDENTIGVCHILGSTFNGEYEGTHWLERKNVSTCFLKSFYLIDVLEISKMLDSYQEETGIDVCFLWYDILKNQNMFFFFFPFQTFQ